MSPVSGTNPTRQSKPVTAPRFSMVRPGWSVVEADADPEVLAGEVAGHLVECVLRDQAAVGDGGEDAGEVGGGGVHAAFHLDRRLDGCGRRSDGGTAGKVRREPGHRSASLRGCVDDFHSPLGRVDRPLEQLLTIARIHRTILTPIYQQRS